MSMAKRLHSMKGMESTRSDLANMRVAVLTFRDREANVMEMVGVVAVFALVVMVLPSLCPIQSYCEM